MRSLLLRLSVVVAAAAAALTLAPASAAAQVEPCFGAVGSKCDGAPKAAVIRKADGSVNAAVSVGSILHDNCCMANPGGKWCGGRGTDGNPAGELNHNGRCDAEWDKAVWNQVDNRYWRADFSGKPDDLTSAGAQRVANVKGRGAVRIRETVSTRRLAAPRGTALDVGDEAFCASGRAGPPQSSWGKNWIVCQ